MRLTNANSLVVILMLTVLSACTYKPEAELIKGHWKYTSVLKGDSKMFEIGDNDRMSIESDSTFTYQIESVNKTALGTWTYSDHVLHLKYNVPDTTRHFKVNILSKYDLQIQEGEVVFNFSRIKTD